MQEVTDLYINIILGGDSINKKSILIVILLSFTLILTGCFDDFISGTGSVKRTGSISGVVVDNNDNPISGVKIEIADKTDETNRNGTFQISDIEVGNHLLTAEFQELDITKSIEIQVEDGSNVLENIKIDVDSEENNTEEVFASGTINQSDDLNITSGKWDAYYTYDESDTSPSTFDLEFTYEKNGENINVDFDYNGGYKSVGYQIQKLDYFIEMNVNKNNEEKRMYLVVKVDNPEIKFTLLEINNENQEDFNFVRSNNETQEKIDLMHEIIEESDNIYYGTVTKFIDPNTDN